MRLEWFMRGYTVASILWIAFAVAVALLTGCVPSLSQYAQHTCSLSHAEWTGEGVPDVNDPSRIAWPVCQVRGVRFAVPPQNPRGDR